MDQTNDYSARSSGNVDDDNDDDAVVSLSGQEANADEEAEDINKIASRETWAVICLRLGLLTVLLVATAVACVSIYVYTSNAEQEDFENAVADNSAKILESFQGAAERRLGAVASFSTMVTAYAIGTNATWPYVTVPQIEAQSAHVLNLANSDRMNFCVVVDPQDRQEWEEEYVPTHASSWMEESKEFVHWEELTSGTTQNGQAPPPSPDYEGKPTRETGDGTSKSGFSANLRVDFQEDQSFKNEAKSTLSFGSSLHSILLPLAL